MTLTHYSSQCALAGFFEIATEDARRLLPKRFVPLEVRYGRSVLVVNVYHFIDSPAGAYDELVYGVTTLPRIIDGVVPKGAVFPFLVATTTAEARAHAIERWHLPHWPEDIKIELRQESPQAHVRASVGGEVILTLDISARQWIEDPRIYQSFMQDDQGAFMTQIHYIGELSEHEEGTGMLGLNLEHPFNARLVGADIDDLAFHEIWMRGRQSFEPLQTLD